MVTLLPKTEKQIREFVDTGQFANADEVVARALELLSNYQKLKRVRELVAEGDAAFARGDYVEVTENFLQEALERAREHSRLGLPIPEHVKP